MSKQELIEAFQSWVASEDFSPDRNRLDELQNQFKELQEASEKEQKENHDPESEEEFQYKKEPEDIRFSELLDIYHDKRKKAEKQKKEEVQNNHSEKKALIDELQELIQDEENVGKAYKRFNAIKQKWNEIGAVPAAVRRDLQADYSRLIEQFYYNINIYRELQINDLKKNLELKKGVIEKIKSLEEEKSINQVDFLIHQYLDEWDQLGPTFQEEWVKIREEFREVVNKVFDRIRDHRKHVREDHKVNYEKKKELVQRVAEIAENELNDVKQVQRLTKEVIDTQKEWKHIGYAGRGKNDEVWKEFRAACDKYFGSRKAFLDTMGKAMNEVRDRKRALIDKAKEIYEGDDMQAIANQLKGLQREWKQSGKLLPQEEFRMFKEFRKYCDDFFNRKKNEAKRVETEVKENLKKKEELLVDFTKELEADIKEKGEKVIEEWKSRWSEVGDVPDRLSNKVEKTFGSIISRAYKGLGISKDEMEEKEFKSRIDIISNKDNPEDGLQNERYFIQRKIKEAQSEVLQLENKMGFFTYSDDSNPLKRDLMKRIEEAQEEVERWKEKRKKIDLTIKGMRQQAEADAPEESGDGEGESTPSEENQEG